MDPGGARVHAPGTIAMESAFVLVSPYGLDLGPAACDALDRAGIVHCRARFPYASDETGTTVVYVIDEARLLLLGPRATVEHALELIGRAQVATTVVLAERGSGATWLAANPFVSGWVVAPADATALVATVRNAAATLTARDDVRIARGES